MSKLVQSYTSWQPLEEVIVGRVYTPEYFSHIADANTRNQLSQILEESNEDLDNLERVIKEYGAVVRRPDLPEINKWRLMLERFNEVPVPPLTPRDWQITLGDKLLRVLNTPETDSICAIYKENDPGCVIEPHKERFDPDLIYWEYNPNHVLVDAVASCIVRVGADVFFDRSKWMKQEQMEWIRDNVLDARYRVHYCQTNGHGDAVFSILKPGVILSSIHDADINYKETFPRWEVCRVEESTISASMKVKDFKSESFNDRWYVQGVEPTSQFANYVDKYLHKWTGFVKETVFDVNCLVLDESNVIFSSYNKHVFDFCERHQINPIISPLRHKYFFDGGISCCTQDIRRRGGLETYL